MMMHEAKFPRYKQIRKMTMHENTLPRYEQIRKKTMHENVLPRYEQIRKTTVHENAFVGFFTRPPAGCARRHLFSPTTIGTRVVKNRCHGPIFGELLDIHLPHHQHKNCTHWSIRG